MVREIKNELDIARKSDFNEIIEKISKVVWGVIRMIELLGLPGAGKTTYANEKMGTYINILESNIYSDNRICQNLNKIVFYIAFVVRKPKDYLVGINKFNKIHFNSVKIMIKMNLYLFMTLGLLDKYKYKDVLIDEGLGQVLWAFYYNSKDSNRAIEDLFNVFDEYCCDTVLFIRAEKDEIKNRLLLRRNNGGSELQKDLLTDSNCLDFAIECMNQVLLVFDKKGIKYSTIEE